MQDMTYLKTNDRDLLALWRAQGIGIREMGRRLKRDPSVICREFARNKTKGEYIAIAAEAKARERKHKAGLREPLKNKELYSLIMEQLKWGWSPQEIAGRLKKENNKVTVICHETIYNFIFDPGNKHLKLWQLLPRGKAKRRKWYGRKTQKEKIPNRVSIHDRPEEIETRKVFGHWEGDSVIGKGHKQAIHTEVERLSRYLQAKYLPEFNSQTTVEAQQAIFKEMPESARKTITLDNGLEFVKHQELTNELGVKVYFADPYSSFQRGTNENTNGLIRRYVPKKTSFKTLTQSDLDDMVWEINNRPKKCLEYATPEEIFISYNQERK